VQASTQASLDGLRGSMRLTAEQQHADAEEQLQVGCSRGGGASSGWWWLAAAERCQGRRVCVCVLLQPAAGAPI
jgi:hypothetical protein